MEQAENIYVREDSGASNAPVVTIDGVTKRFGGGIIAVDNLSLSMEQGEFLALLGPSGCGKSTTLRLLAGLEAPDAGAIRLGGTAVAGGAAWVPPEQRRIGMVFQDFALFPHLTIEGNIAFPLASEERSRRTARVAELLELVGMAGSEKRYPHQISGGQQQRVALARALATNPELVLLDEPFSNLDASLRESTREEVRRILSRAGATTILVTHDQEEALSLADSVAVMFDGAITQLGRPEEIYLKPSDKRVARFVGAARFLRGEAAGDRVTCAVGTLPLAVPTRGQVSVLVRPEALALRPDAQGRARVVARTFFGSYQVARVRLPGDETIEVRLPAQMMVREGERCEVAHSGPVVAFRE